MTSISKWRSFNAFVLLPTSKITPRGKRRVTDWRPALSAQCDVDPCIAKSRPSVRDLANPQAQS
jgi:hypothetical protein